MTRGEKPTARGLTILAEMLDKNFSFNDVSIAIECHLNESSFFPTLADIAKQVRNPQGEAWDAWRVILEHIKRQGYMVQPSISNAAKNALDCIGGYSRLCEMESDQINIVAAQFCRAYDSMQKRERFKNELKASNGKDLLKLSESIGNSFSMEKVLK